MDHLWLIWAQFGPKRVKPCQLRGSISRQWVKIFEFRKKRLNPHMQDIKICEREKNLKFSPGPPPIALRVFYNYL